MLVQVEEAVTEDPPELTTTSPKPEDSITREDKRAIPDLTDTPDITEATVVTVVLAEEL